MYAYSELVDPSVVTHSVFWETSKSVLLVLVKGGTLLQVYTDFGPETRLLAEYSLQGVVTQLETLDDKLLIAFQKAKLSVLQWKPSHRDFETCTLHYYENLPAGVFDTGPRFNAQLNVNARSKHVFYWFQESGIALLNPKKLNSALSLLNEDVSGSALGSTIIDAFEFKNVLEISTICQIGLLNAFFNPTVYVLYSNKPEWVGFESVEGKQTKNLAVMSLNQDLRVISTFSGLDSSIEQVISVNNDVVLIGERHIYILHELVDLSAAITAENASYANCIGKHIPNTPLVLLALSSGAVLVLNTRDASLTELSNVQLPNPTTISVHNNYVFIGSKSSSAVLLNIEFSKPQTLQFNENVLQTYESALSAEPETFKLKCCECISTFFTPGSMSAVVEVEGGLAVATNEGILLVHKYVPLEKIETFRDLGEAKTWLWKDSNEITVLSSSENRTICQREGTEIQIKGVLDSMMLVAVSVLENAVVIVQTEQIVVVSKDLETVLAQISTDKIFFAEIGAKSMLVHTESCWSRYNLELELEGTYDCENMSICDTAAAYPDNLVTASASSTCVQLNTVKYELADLPQIPAVYSEQEENEENDENEENKEKIVSVQLMRFGNYVYLGVHCDHSYAIYELRGEEPPIKVYSVPFVVNRSPIWLPDLEQLVFVGSNTHVVYKDTLHPFRCHSLGLRGVDATSCGNCLALVDPDTTMRVYRVLYGVDLYSLNLPVEYVKLAASETPISIAYHDGLDALIIGLTNSAEKCGAVKVLQLETFELDKEYALKLENHELILTMALIDQNKKQVLALGTSILEPENVETNGYARLYSIKEVDNLMELKEVDSVYVRGPVSRVCESMDYLIVAHGQQVHVFDANKKLEQVAFYDAQIYLQSLHSVRNILVFSDRIFGTRLINFTQQPPQLYDLAQIPQNGDQLVSTCTAAPISSAVNQELAVASFDLTGLMKIYQFDPDSPESMGGSRLVPLATFYTGRTFSSFAMVINDNDDLMSFGVADDGAIVLLRPVSEQNFRSLHILSQQLIDRDPRLARAGLNSKAFRGLMGESESLATKLVDADIAKLFWSLPLDQQEFIAQKLGFKGLAKVRRAADNSNVFFT